MKWILAKLFKIKLMFKSRGLSQTLLFLVNWILLRSFGLSLVKNKSSNNFKISNKIFSKCSLKKSEHGYWFLNPMPSEKELDEYYESLYWEGRDGKNDMVNTRDLIHFDILKKYVNEFQENKTLMNFGSGHGGLSHLAWIKGLKIINIEPGGMDKYYRQRWQFYKSINEAPDDSADILYGSHSLEHVQDIDKFLIEAKRVLKNDGIMFWEVPNALCETNGAMRGIIDIPHTYYYTTKFFENLFNEIILNMAFDEEEDTKVDEWENYNNPRGPIIRAIGRFSN